MGALDRLRALVGVPSAVLLALGARVLLTGLTLAIGLSLAVILALLLAALALMSHGRRLGGTT